MNIFMTMMVIILAATVILILGIRLNYDPDRSLDGTITETVSWGVGFFLSFSSQAALFFLD